MSTEATASQSSSSSQSQSGSSGTSGATGSSGQNTTSQAGTTTHARPEWVTTPESWDEKAGKLKDGYSIFEAKRVSDAEARIAALDVHRNTLPKTADDYKPALPKDWKAPEGSGFEFKPDEVSKNPMFKQLQQVMHDIDQGKLSGQDAFAKLIELNVAQRLSTDQVLKTRAGEEKAALGANADARIQAVHTWAKAIVGDEMFKHLQFGMFTAKQIEAFETIIKKFTSQGGANFSQAHRDPTAGSEQMTNERWATMSFAEKQVWQAEQTKRAH